VRVVQQVQQETLVNQEHKVIAVNQEPMAQQVQVVQVDQVELADQQEIQAQ
jgi:hypothetical protein